MALKRHYQVANNMTELTHGSYTDDTLTSNSQMFLSYDDMSESTIVIMNKKLYKGHMSYDAGKECKLRP